MLVIRNFGYLGLHSAIHSKSSLARDRLVDFTGEKQVRRKNSSERESSDLETNRGESRSKNTFVAPKWHDQFIAEDTIHGGRVAVKRNMSTNNNIESPNINNENNNNNSTDNDLEHSALYAQEVAPIPIALSTPSSSRRKHLDAEPTFYTNFCNELLVHPRLIHNCPKRNIVIRLEIRHFCYSEKFKSMVAIPIEKPMLHNPRRGPFLVHEVFTSCAYHKFNPYFLDEFKIKLPLCLEEGCALFLSAYNISVKGKKRTAARVAKAVLSRRYKTIKESGNFTFDNKDSNESSLIHPSLDFLACGFLPLNTPSDPTCLVRNDLHDVELIYSSRSMPSSDSNHEDNENNESPLAWEWNSPNTNHCGAKVKDHFGIKVPITQHNILPNGTLLIEPLNSNTSIESPSSKQHQTQISNSASSLSSENNNIKKNNNNNNDYFTTASPNSSDISTETASHPPLPPSSIYSSDSNKSFLPRVLLTAKTNHNNQREEEPIILQIRTISLSSVYAQNPSMANFFLHAPKITPRRLFVEHMSWPWYASKEELSGGRMVWDHVDTDLANIESKLLQYTVELSQAELCPIAELNSHLLRVLTLLFRIIVTGTGEPSLAWADPSSLIPLRVHAFSTMLHVLNASTAFQAKGGVTQLDGRAPWGMTNMSKIVSLIFDEGGCFGATDDAWEDEWAQDDCDFPDLNIPTHQHQQYEMETELQEKHHDLKDDLLVFPNTDIERSGDETDLLYNEVDNISNLNHSRDSINYSIHGPINESLNQSMNHSTQADHGNKNKILTLDTTLDCPVMDKTKMEIGVTEIHNNKNHSTPNSTPTPPLDDRDKTLFSSLILENDGMQHSKEAEINQEETAEPNRKHIRRHRMRIPKLDSTDSLSSDNSKDNISIDDDNSNDPPSNDLDTVDDHLFTLFSAKPTDVKEDDARPAASTPPNEKLNPNPFNTISFPCSNITTTEMDSPGKKSADDGASPDMDEKDPLERKPSHGGNAPRKVDTKVDFLSALKSSEGGPASSDHRVVTNGISPFGTFTCSPGAGRRRWSANVQSPNLATIKEDDDHGDVKQTSTTKKISTNTKDPCNDFDFAAAMSEPDDTPLRSDALSLVEDILITGDSAGSEKKVGDALDTELILTSGRQVKQFRIPFKQQPQELIDDPITTIDTSSLQLQSKHNEINSIAEDKSVSPSSKSAKEKNSVQGTSDDIERVGTAFLDMIGKNLGYQVGGKDMGGEERSVGIAHHRKTRSRCSIDWSLPPIDFTENQRSSGGDFDFSSSLISFMSPSPDNQAMDSEGKPERKIYGEHVDTKGSPKSIYHEEAGIVSNLSNNERINTDHASTDTLQKREIMSPYASSTSTVPVSITSATLSGKPKPPASSKLTPPTGKKSSKEKKKCKTLRSYVDRVFALRKSIEHNRWFAYTYEVIIFQWLSLLLEQTNRSEQISGGNNTSSSGSTATKAFPLVVTKSLAESATKARGITIGCAPVLFEMIKKSLARRVHKIMIKSKSHPSTFATPLSPPSSSTNESNKVSVTLDPDILSALEKLISIMTDACIDSRNFDSRSFRQTCIDVNDATVRFLRDLFAFLDTATVYKLVMVYFSRFVTKEGKVWQDRDSKLGLRCSWEVCKLRLNAVTLFVRFPGLVWVNKPIMETWDKRLTSAPVRSTRQFYTKALEDIEKLGMAEFAAAEVRPQRLTLKIPPLRPHWLTELVVDILLNASEHAEQQIQHRASSLLYELFWSQSQEGKANGTLSIIASMHVSFIYKILAHLSYLSSLPAKSQLRKDILPCIIFVMQNAPVGLLRAMWRKLIRKTIGKGSLSKYGGVGAAATLNFADEPDFDMNINHTTSSANNETLTEDEPCILDVFSLLNLCLKTFEYEGSEGNLGNDEDNFEIIATWRKEFLLSEENDVEGPSPSSLSSTASKSKNDTEKDKDDMRYGTTSSRKWYAHDGATVIIRTSRYIVNETLFLLRPGAEESSKNSFSLNESKRPSSSSSFLAEPTDGVDKKYVRHRRKGHHNQTGNEISGEKPLKFSISDEVIFARATISVYLHALSLHQSDVVVIKTLTAAVEIVKIFGIKVFLDAVGETLQHWMRVLLSQCGARRAAVRVQALEFLALILRLTWDSYGSFFRIRVPMLAVQNEVMERIVATAATKQYREYRHLGIPVENMSNEAAEATLAPLWKTLYRLHHKSGSKNEGFRMALMRLAETMKKLYKAYVAAHAISFANQSQITSSPKQAPTENGGELSQASAYARNMTLRLKGITAVSAGLSKQFLGLHSLRDTVIHNEAIEDAFLAAADVFSPRELPSHRVAWLQKLAEFHVSRTKYAEEATCHFHIHSTLRQAALLHSHLWNSVPFLPWAIESSDGVHLDWEGPTVGPSDYLRADSQDLEDSSCEENFDPLDGKTIEKNNSFRRIFYRVANSVRMRTGDWDVSGNKNLFYGVTSVAEFNTIGPRKSLREMEEEMVEESETAGDLFLKAGIVESSRYAWSIATQFYSDTFNYGRLAYVYRRLAMVVAWQVPVVDTSNRFEMSSPLGRFYKVWFHGGEAPEELVGVEYVYRAAADVKLEKFGNQISEVLKYLLPDDIPIDLVLDDRRAEEPSQKKKNRYLTKEPIKIKVTPLRPIIKRERFIRGSAEWFYHQTDNRGFCVPTAINSNVMMIHEEEKCSPRFNVSPRHRARNQDNSSVSFSSRVRTMESPTISTMNGSMGLNSNVDRDNTAVGGSLIGVDKFSFSQPKGTRDWFKAPPGEFSEKSLRVTELQVEQCFPACVSRQRIIQRAVFNQSPLEAGVEAVCSWCAVLFRTAVATNGLSIIGAPKDQGIGTAAAKVVSDCIHLSKVKEMGQHLLKEPYVTEVNGSDEPGSTMTIRRRGKLTDEEVKRFQSKLARAIVIFMELLHLLIARNRDMLMALHEARKREKNQIPRGGKVSLGSNPSSPDSVERHKRKTNMSSNRSVGSEAPGQGHQSDRKNQGDEGDKSPMRNARANERTDAAIAIQIELQRAFISMAKLLYPLISNVIRTETPRWLKLCCHEGYFSMNIYKQTRLSMGEELFFSSYGNTQNPGTEQSPKSDPFSVPLANFSSDTFDRNGSPSGGYCDSSASTNSGNESLRKLNHQRMSQSSMPVLRKGHDRRSFATRMSF